AFDKDRQLAATAIFRLGECYRKLGKTNEAVVQYERIVREFGDQQTLVTLSEQNLTGLGAAETQNPRLKALMRQREAENAQPAATFEAIQQLRVVLAKAEAEYDQKKTMLNTLKQLSRTDLKRVLPTVVSDNQLNTLLAELDLAEQNLLKLKAEY